MPQAECNIFACNFDGYDCSYTIPLYENCSAVQHGVPCYSLFKNSVCDTSCSSADCLYDGGDCSTAPKECNPIYDAYCQLHFVDGHCDAGCNSAECNWDGGDCVATAEHKYITGVLIITILVPPEEFVLSKSTVFFRDLGTLLHCIVTFEKDGSGNNVISPWPNPGSSQLRRRRSHNSIVSRQKRTSTSG